MIIAAAAGDYAWYLDLAIWSGVVFLVLLAILAKFVATPVASAMDERQKSTLETLSQAQIAQERVRELRRQQEQQKARSRERAVALIADAERDAKRLREEIVARMQAECEVLLARMEREIELVRRRSVHELWRTTTDVTTTVAEKILRTRLTDDDHRRLVDEAIAEIAVAAKGTSA
jgi:F-type H+-transporting ATPase subunit b